VININRSLDQIEKNCIYSFIECKVELVSEYDLTF